MNKKICIITTLISMVAYLPSLAFQQVPAEQVSFIPTATIGSTNVQDALEEFESELVAETDPIWVAVSNTVAKSATVNGTNYPSSGGVITLPDYPAASSGSGLTNDTGAAVTLATTNETSTSDAEAMTAGAVARANDAQDVAIAGKIDTELDPIWVAASNDYTLTTDVNATNEAQDTVIDGKVSLTETRAVTIDAANANTNVFGGTLTVLGEAVKSSGATSASGIYGATALGRNTIASGDNGATALGNYTEASGSYGATALGRNTIASGSSGATALGYNSTATHDSSFVFSDGTSTSSTTTKQYTVYASNGIRLLGAPTEGVDGVTDSEFATVGQLNASTLTNDTGTAITLATTNSASTSDTEAMTAGAVARANEAQDTVIGGKIDTELDPIWSAVSNSVTTSYVAKSGDTMTGDLTLDDGASHSPAFFLIDQSDELLRIYKSDGGRAILTCSQGFQLDGNIGLDMTGDQITTLGTGTAATDAVNLGQVTNLIASSSLTNNAGTAITLATTNSASTSDTEAMTAGAVARAVADSFQGARQDLGVSTNVTWLPTRYSGKWSPTNSATFAMSTDADYPRATYSLWVYTNSSITFDAAISLQNSITPSGTNLYIIGVADTADTWTAVGRAF